MANGEWHLSISKEDRLKMLRLLTNEEFREGMENDPVGTLAANGIHLTAEDLNDIVKANLRLPPIEELQGRMSDFEAEISSTGWYFGRFFPIFCRSQ